MVTDIQNHPTMKAAIHTAYGPPSVLKFGEIEKPALADDSVLVRVRAISLNAGDWYALTGTPYVARVQQGLRRPKSRLLGTDFAGTVEAVGKNVTGFQPGDEVFGGRSGAFAECLTVKNAVEHKPANISFEEAAAVPVAALTALQGLRDKGKVQPGQKVLINGASGGVGTYAVQIAKAFGAEVTAVCSTRNVELVRSLGADHVIDYTKEDFTRGGQRYDLMLDVAGSRPWSACKRVLTPEATLVLVGAPKGSKLLGPLGHIAGVKLASFRGGRTVIFFIAKFNKPDMAVLREMLESGKVRSVIDRRYPFSELPDALCYLGEGHAQGKVVLTL